MPNKKQCFEDAINLVLRFYQLDGVFSVNTYIMSLMTDWRPSNADDASIDFMLFITLKTISYRLFIILLRAVRAIPKKTITHFSIKICK